MFKVGQQVLLKEEVVKELHFDIERGILFLEKEDLEGLHTIDHIENVEDYNIVIKINNKEIYFNAHELIPTEVF